MKKHIIKVPHLRNEIIVRRYKKGDLEHAKAFAKKVCPELYELVLPLPIRGKETATTLVHEIIHLLQYYVKDNYMSFTHEREHLAYLAQYIFEEVCKIK